MDTPRVTAAQRIRECVLPVLCTALLVILFYATPFWDGHLGSGDWGVHFHYYDWIRTSLTEYKTLPLYMADAAHSTNFVANAQSPLFGPMIPLLAFVPTDAYLKLLILVYLVVGAISFFALLKDLKVSREIAVISSVLFAFNGYFTSHIAIGHHWALGSLLLPTLLLFIRRAIQSTPHSLWIASLVNAISLFEGQHHPFIWNNIFIFLHVGMLAWESKSTRPFRTWLCFIGLSVGLGAIKILPMISEFGSYAPQERIPGIPPVALLWSLVWPGQSPSTEIPSVAFTYGAGWWEYCFYLGIPGILLVAMGFANVRARMWAWLLPALFFLMIGLDLSHNKIVPDPWSLLKDLPVLNSQRCPSRFIITAITGFLVPVSIGLQKIWLRVSDQRPQFAKVVFVIVVTVLLLDLGMAARPWHKLLDSPSPPHNDHSFGGIAQSGGALKLLDFSPNRLTYQSNSQAPFRAVLLIQEPKRRDEWSAIGADQGTHDGLIYVDVPAGVRRLDLVYRPGLFMVGVLVSIFTSCSLLIYTILGRARHWAAKRP